LNDFATKRLTHQTRLPDIVLLNNVRILVVEDEPYIALELQAVIEEAGGAVVGPVGSVSAALKLLQTCVVAAAVLDVQLSDRDVTPVVEVLAARGVPVVFQSAKDMPGELQRRCPDAVVYQKPVSAESLLETLRKITRRDGPSD
jgi:CheY-like chemotaxis protein